MRSSTIGGLGFAGFILFVAAVLSMGGAALHHVNTADQPQASFSEPKVITEVLDPSLDQFSEMWRQETSRRFDHAVCLLVHGGDIEEGRWIVEGDFANHSHDQPITNIIDKYHRLYPDRTLVVLACNPGHVSLHGFPNVYVSPSSVWCVPDREVGSDSSANDLDKLMSGNWLTDLVPMSSRWKSSPDSVGNVFELVEAR